MKLLAALTKLQNLHTECLTRFQRYKDAQIQNRPPKVVKQIYDSYAHHCYLFDTQLSILRSVVRDADLLDLEVPTVSQYAIKGHSLTGESGDELPNRVADAKDWPSIADSDRAH